MAIVATWILIASMAAYFHAMNLAYAELEAAAAANTSWENTSFWSKVKTGFGF